MNILDKVLIVVASVAGMELFAWAAHRWIMHGVGWAWHRDHHEPHDRVLERNDLYAVVFGIGVMGLFGLGLTVAPVLWWVAWGITVYGAIYTAIHDGLVHGRWFRWVPKRGYAKRLVQAHRLHHATVGREGGVSFGFIWAPDPARLKAELKRQRVAGIAKLREAALD